MNFETALKRMKEGHLVRRKMEPHRGFSYDEDDRMFKIHSTQFPWQFSYFTMFSYHYLIDDEWELVEIRGWSVVE